MYNIYRGLSSTRCFKDFIAHEACIHVLHTSEAKHLLACQHTLESTQWRTIIHLNHPSVYVQFITHYISTVFFQHQFHVVGSLFYFILLYFILMTYDALKCIWGCSTLVRLFHCHKDGGWPAASSGKPEKYRSEEKSRLQRSFAEKCSCSAVNLCHV